MNGFKKIFAVALLSFTASANAAIVDLVDLVQVAPSGWVIQDEHFTSDYHVDINDQFRVNNSETTSHVSVNGFGSGFIDEYSFNITQPGSLFVDIDDAWKLNGLNANLDTWVELYDTAGLVAWNDDSHVVLGGVLDSGSGSHWDSFLYVADSLDAGQYKLLVGGTNAYDGISQGQTYTLHIATAVPEPATYALMLGGLGLVGFMASRRRKQA